MLEFVGSRLLVGSVQERNKIYFENNNKNNGDQKEENDENKFYFDFKRIWLISGIVLQQANKNGWARTPCSMRRQQFCPYPIRKLYIYIYIYSKA